MSTDIKTKELRPLESDFWPQDIDGFLLNDASVDKIPPGYLPLIEDIKQVYMDHSFGRLHSLYLFGSVPRGKATTGLSDIDVLGVMKGKAEWVINNWTNLGNWKEPEGRRILEAYPIISNVVFDFEPLSFVTEQRSFFWPTFLLSVGGVCIYGKDLVPQLPRFKPDEVVANSELVQLDDNIHEAIREIQKATSSERVTYWCRRIMKNLLRDGFFLNMAEDNRFTPDVGFCYVQFSKHYPEQAGSMKKALDYGKNPTTKKTEIIEFLNTFGAWLVVETDRWLDKNNPSRLRQLPLKREYIRRVKESKKVL